MNCCNLLYYHFIYLHTIVSMVGRWLLCSRCVKMNVSTVSCICGNPPYPRVNIESNVGKQDNQYLITHGDFCIIYLLPIKKTSLWVTFIMSYSRKLRYLFVWWPFCDCFMCVCFWVVGWLLLHLFCLYCFACIVLLVLFCLYCFDCMVLLVLCCFHVGCDVRCICRFFFCCILLRLMLF